MFEYGGERIKLYLKLKDSLPISYSYYLTSYFIRTLEKVNEDVAAFLHGFQPFKPFNFSRILVKPDEVKNGKLIFRKKKPGVLYISSPYRDLLREIIEGIVLRKGIMIRGNRIEVEGIEECPPPAEGFKFSTLSPIVASTKRNGKKVYLKPTDPEFYEKLILNVVNRYKFFTGKEIKRVNIEVEEARPRPVRVKGGIVQAYDMKGKLEGDREVLEFIWWGGLGEKTGLGFGMVGRV